MQFHHRNRKLETNATGILLRQALENDAPVFLIRYRTRTPPIPFVKKVAEIQG